MRESKNSSLTPKGWLILKKFVIFYFSGTGNTWWVTGKMAAALRDRGAEAGCYSIEEVDPAAADSLIAQSDAVGFGYPTYGSDLPETMKAFMRKLSDQKKEAFLYCTQWLWSGDGARVGTEFLGPGFQVRWAEHFLMPNNVSVAILRLPYTNDKGRMGKVLKRAERKIQKFAGRISSGRPFLRGFNALSELSGYIQRGPFRRMYERLRDDISVDPGRCTRCEKCIRACPVENLYLGGGTVRARGRCILCLRCYSFCPVIAVEYMGKAHDPKRGEPYRGPVEGFDPELLRPENSR